MSGPLMECDVHGIVESNEFFDFADKQNVSFVGDMGFQCPHCDNIGQVLQGTYSNKAGVTTASLMLTGKQYRALRQTLTWAEQEMAKPVPDLPKVEKVLEKTIEKQAPGLRGWLKEWLPTIVGGSVPVLVEVVKALMNTQANQTVSVEDLAQIVDAAVRAAVETQNKITPESGTAELP